MNTAHKNKTFATLLAAVLGGIGLHRFYVHGKKDFWGWAHFLTLPLSGLIMIGMPGAPRFFTLGPLEISVLCAFIEALVIGLTPDETWDRRHNARSGKQSQSHWVLALLLVLTMGIGAIAVIAAISRLFDLLYTGGAYG